MSHYGYFMDSGSDIAHHGVKGMKWGVRRYQNADGSLTSEGMRRYSHMSPTKSDSSVTKRVKNDWHNLSNDQFMSKYKTSKDTYARRVKKYGDPYKNGTGPKIARALNKSGITKVTNTINRKTGATKILANRIKKNSQDWMAVRDLKVRSRKNISDLRSSLKSTNDKSKRREYRKQIFANNRNMAFANLPLPMTDKARYARATENNKRLDTLVAPLAVASNPLTIAPNAISNMSQNAAIAYTNHKLKKSQKS